jgi:hypothetical protein
MEIRVLSDKKRLQPCGSRNEIGMVLPCFFDGLAAVTLGARHLGKLDHFVVADGRRFAMPEGADTATCPIGELARYGRMNAVDHVALASPAVAGDFGYQFPSERYVRHSAPLSFQICGQDFHDCQTLPVLRFEAQAGATWLE